MSRKLYVTSKEFSDGARLIGILHENNGKFQFEYKLGGIVHEWFLSIKEFPDVSRIYSDTEVAPFIDRIIPRKNSPYLQGLLESANLKEYDVWELLKIFGQRNMKEDAVLHENLPERIIMYEKLDTSS